MTTVFFLGRDPNNANEPAVVGIPRSGCVANTSLYFLSVHSVPTQDEKPTLTIMGIPWSGPPIFPELRSSSSCFTLDKVKLLGAWEQDCMECVSFKLCLSIWSKKLVTKVALVTSPLFNISRSSATDSVSIFVSLSVRAIVKCLFQGASSFKNPVGTIW